MSPQAPEALSRFAQNRYLTYPHNNGFSDGGRTLVLGEFRDDTIALVAMDTGTGETRRTIPLGPTAGFGSENDPYFDVSLESGRVVFVAGNALWMVELRGEDPPLKVFQQPDSGKLGGLVNLRPDGAKVLVPLKDAGGYAALEVDLASGTAREVIRKRWWAHHFHYSPHDPEWIGFCHEGQCEKTPDRLWAYHPEQAPVGRPLFDQRWDEPESRLYLGHERWCFHDSALLVVAYGHGPGSPRGIYEVYADGRPPVLFGEGDRDWHAGVSRDGRLAVVDTTGPHDLPGRGWDGAGRISDIVLLDRKSGERQFQARSRHFKHPSHPHPTFSPDGQWIYYNEIDESLTWNRILRVRNPWWDRTA